MEEYFSLKEENKKLAAENAALREELTIGVDSMDLDLPVLDSNLMSNYDIVSAKVISNVGLNRRVMTINRGSKQGISMESGVISGNGIVGKVVGLNTNYALVMPILHTDSRVNVQHVNSGFNGNLVWDGRSLDEAQVQNIPRNARVNVGDTIRTNSFSRSFTEGSLVAVVNELNYDLSGNFYLLGVTPLADFRRLNYVYVTTQKDIEEIKTLEEGGGDE